MSNSLAQMPRGDEIVSILESNYPRIKTPLKHNSPFQLLLATILSAQCTDAQVNKVTPTLFGKFPDAVAMSKAKVTELEKIVKSTGFFRIKARRIKEVSKRIVKDFGGVVPQTMEDLTSLPGVGRKTANIVLSAGFSRIDGIAVDTHVHRLSNRIGLSNEKTPEKIEEDLMRITSKENWPQLSMLLILHGRTVCVARKPLCEKCGISSKCLYFCQNQSRRSDN